MKNKLYTYEQDLKKRLEKPVFRKAWEETELEYKLGKQLIEKRLAKKLSQRALADKLRTSQAVISRIETMRANPSLEMLKRIADVLEARLTIQLS